MPCSFGRSWEPLTVLRGSRPSLITGTVGAGKTSVTGEISDLLAQLELPHAALDLDAPVWQWPADSDWNNELMFQNLRELWPNYADHGATHLVLARVVEDRSELDRYRHAVPGADITVCRVLAPEAERLTRLRRRMAQGSALDWHLARTVQLEAALEAGRVEDFAVDNGDRSLREVAAEVLTRAGWVVPNPQGEVRSGRDVSPGREGRLGPGTVNC